MASTSSIGSSNIGAQIDTLITQFTQQETNSKVVPIQDNQKRYQNISDGYDKLSTLLTDLQTSSSTLKQTGNDSVFGDKTTTSSNKDFVTATATSAASA